MAESRAAKQTRARKILELLDGAYPDATIALNFRTPFELLVATILSAQCTDERVNMVTPALFRKYPTARELARARTPTLEKEIRSTGFFRAKTRSLLGMSKALVERHGGEVPREREALVELPGVGLKTANVVIGNAFGGVQRMKIGVRDRGVPTDENIISETEFQFAEEHRVCKITMITSANFSFAPDREMDAVHGAMIAKHQGFGLAA